MDDFCDEHDSAELLMMQIDFPEDASQAGGFLQKTIFEGKGSFNTELMKFSMNFRIIF